MHLLVQKLVGEGQYIRGTSNKKDNREMKQDRSLNIL